LTSPVPSRSRLEADRQRRKHRAAEQLPLLHGCGVLSVRKSGLESVWERTNCTGKTVNRPFALPSCSVRKHGIRLGLWFGRSPVGADGF
jgi:hypothetical protein